MSLIRSRPRRSALTACAGFAGAAVASLLVACVGDTAQPTGDDAATPADGGPPKDGATSDGPDAAPTCGAPNQACCAGSCSGGAQCNSGTCACAGPTTACGSSCVDEQKDPLNCGACGHSCLGGACTAGVCQPIQIATGQGSVTGVALDANSVYWSRAFPASGAIFRADRDGKNATPLQDYGTNAYVYVVGASQGYVYYRRSTSSTSGFFRCKLPDCNGGPAKVADALGSVTSGVIDEANQRLYYARYTPYNQAANGTIFSVPLDGSEAPAQAITSGTEASPLILELVGTTLFWLNGGTYIADNFQYDGAIRRAPIGKGQTATTVATLQNYVDPGAFAADGKNAYANGSNRFTNGADLVVVSTLGGSASPMVPNSGRIYAMYADATGLYWAADDGKLDACPANGCTGKPSVIWPTAGAGVLSADPKAFVWGTNGGFVWILAR